METDKQKEQYQKMVGTPVGKLIVVLSIPTIISMLVTNIYNLVDTAFVGTLGNSASGAIGIVFGFMAILQAIGFMFGQGAGSIMSRRLGNKDVEGASAAASLGFFGAFALSTLVGIVCLIFLDPLVYLLGSTTTIAPYAKTYIFCIIMAAPFLVTSYTMNNLLRYEGKAFLGMIGMLTGAVLNICLDALFIKGMHLGIEGAGIATAISQVVSFLILLSMFLRHKISCTLSLKNCRHRGRLIWDIMSTGFPSMLRQGLTSLTTVILNTQVAVYGDAAVAAMSIVSRVAFFVFSVAIGIGQGYQPVSAFNYGAKRYDRVRKGFRVAFIYGEIILVFLVVVVLLKGGSIVHIFRDDDQVVEIGTRALYLLCLSQLALPYCMLVEMLFQSTGNRLQAIVLSGLRNGLIFIPVLMVLAYVRGLAGIQEAQPLSNVISLVPSVLLAIPFFKKLKEG